MKLLEGLARLEGRAGAVARAVVVAALVVTALIAAFGGWLAARDYFVNIPSDLRFGFATSTSRDPGGADYPTQIGAVASEEAMRSGLKRGDRIVSIDGEPIPADAIEHDIGDRMQAISGNAVTLVARSPDGTVKTHRLTRQPDRWSEVLPHVGMTGHQQMIVRYAIEQSVLLFLFVAGAVLTLRRRRDPVALLIALGLFMMCNALPAGFWFWHYLGVATVANTLNMLAFVLLAIAVAVFPDGRFPFRWTIWLVVSILAVGTAMIGAEWLRIDVPATVRWPAFALLLIAAAAGLAHRYRRLPVGPERQQIKWAVAGFVAAAAIFALIWTLGTLGLPLVPGRGAHVFVTWHVLAHSWLVLFPLGLLVSLTRYRLYDAEAAISRSTTYGAMTVTIVAIFAAGEKLLEAAGQTYLQGTVGEVSGGIAAALAAVSIAPVHRGVSHWSERRFQKHLLGMRRRLPELAEVLRESAGLEAFAAAATARVAAGVRARHVAMLVEGEVVGAHGIEGEAVERWLAGWTPPVEAAAVRDKADPLFPLRLPLSHDGETVCGWLLLGPRPDGTLYGKDERAALDEVTPALARAVIVIRAREARDRAQREWMEQVGARLTALEAGPVSLSPSGLA